MRTYSRPFSSLYVSQLTSPFPLSLNRHKIKLTRPVSSFSRAYSSGSNSSINGGEPILGTIPLASLNTIGTVHILLTANHPSSFITEQFVNQHWLEVEDIGKGIKVMGDVLVKQAAWVPLLLESPTKSTGLSIRCLVLPEDHLDSMVPLKPRIDMTLGICDLFDLRGIMDYGERSLVITLEGGLKFKLQATGRSLPFEMTCLNP